MISSHNKYDLTERLRKHSTSTITVLDKLFEVLSKKWKLEKDIKECRDQLIKALNNNEIEDTEIEEWFSKLDPIIYQVSPDLFDIHTSIESFENIKDNHDKNLKLPWFWKRILKLLLWLERKNRKDNNEPKKIWIKWFWAYIENENDDWLNNLENVYSQTFINNYKRNILEYISKYDDIPTLKEMLKTTFCMSIKQSILAELQKNQFNENDYKESFWVIADYLSDKWITLEPSDNIQESFIEECRNRYPLAKNSCNHLFENKNFKNEFINKISSEIENEIEEVFENIYRDSYRILNRNDMERHFTSMELMLNKILWKYQEFKNSSNWKSDMISLYFLAIADKFEEDHLKKLKKTENTPSTKNKNIDKKEEKIKGTINTYKFLNTEKKSSTLDKNIEEKFDKVVLILWWDNAKKESMKRYLVNLYKKELPINFAHFMKIFNIQELPPKGENIILDKIGMEFEAEEEIKETKKIWEEEKKETIIQPTESIEIEDPTSYMVDSFKNLGYYFINEENFIWQTNEFCKSDSQKTILKNLLINPRFWKVLQHKAWCKDIRTLNIWRTGWRVLMVKINGNIYIDWYYNHNDYEQRLDLIKKGKVKIKRLI